MKAKHLLLIVAGLASASAIAQPQIQSNPAAAGGPWIPLMAKTENGITYVCGGVGQNEAMAMKAAAKKADFDMMVTFAASNGAYLADVNVDVADARGKSVLSTTCDGPMMLINFDKGGKYSVRAETAGRAITRTAQIKNGGKLKRVAMSWPVSVVDMGLTPRLEERVTNNRSASSSPRGADGAMSGGGGERGSAGTGSR